MHNFPVEISHVLCCSFPFNQALYILLLYFVLCNLLNASAIFNMLCVLKTDFEMNNSSKITAVKALFLCFCFCLVRIMTLCHESIHQFPSFLNIKSFYKHLPALFVSLRYIHFHHFDLLIYFKMGSVTCTSLSFYNWYII